MSVVCESIDSLIEEMTKEGELIESEVLVIKNQEVIFNKVYGKNSLQKTDSAQNNYIWAVKSVTKPFTATAILMLRDEGLLSLDDPVTKYIPNYSGYEQTTIKNLLTHSSGDDNSFGNGGYNVYDFSTQEKWVLAWAEEKAHGEFGEFHYSEFNYEALGYIITQVTEQPVEQYIIEKIIRPLNMSDTYTHFTPESSWSFRVPDRFRRNNDSSEYDTLWTNKDAQPWKFFPASFGLWMSAEDFSAFLQMWLSKGNYKGQQIIKESTVDEALQIRVKINNDEDYGHGYGWFIDSEPMLHSYGGGDGSFGFVFPQENVIFVFTTHMQNGVHKGKIMDLLGSLLFGWDE